MNEITPGNVHLFLKRFRLKGGWLVRFTVRSRPEAATAEIRLRVHDAEANAQVRLRLVFDGVEEYRFQRRPGPGLVRLKDVQLAFFGPLVYLNLDAFPEDGPPKVMDFRASDCFLAGRSLRWEVVAKKPAG